MNRKLNLSKTESFLRTIRKEDKDDKRKIVFSLILGKGAALLYKSLLVLLSIVFCLYSYFWLDYALLLMLAQTRPFLMELKWLIDFCSANRGMLAEIYIFLIFALFILQLATLFSRLVKRLSIKSLFVIAVLTTLAFSFSYPFLFADFFTYIFSAKMIMAYHANPYKIPPEKFMSSDLWLGFMRNIEFTYTYGPVALSYSLIPVILFSEGRFLLNFFGLKLMNAVVFYLTGSLIFKITKDKNTFSLWFFNPFLVLELLMNAHNDLLMIFLFVIFIYFLQGRHPVKAFFAFAASVLVKYFSVIALPLLFLSKDKRKLFLKMLALVVPLLLSIQRIRLVQSWYYSWVFLFLPFLELKGRTLVVIYLIGFILAVNYFSFIKLGYWGGRLFGLPKKIFYFFFLGW